MNVLFTKSIQIVIIAILSMPSMAQNENNNWYFGANSFIDFTGGTPSPGVGNLNTFEGCASISSMSGAILFYTDGLTVYNRLGATMTNGTGLLGNPSSTSSAIIVPKPCSTTEYYVFTVDFVNGSNGINYSLINMDDNNDGIYDPVSEFGYLELATKNVNLPGPSGERICAVKHINDTDYWVTATAQNTNSYYTYLVTNGGVAAPIIQNLGASIFAGYYMKFSPDGTRMVRTNGSTAEVLIYDFDTNTGNFSNEQLVGTVPTRPYGVEFSADSSRLFYSDFANGNGTGIGYIFEAIIFPTLGTPVQIASIPNQGGRYAVGALQRSPADPNIIYAAMDGENFLGAIDVSLSTFNRAAVALPNTCYLGLPTFVSGQVSRDCLVLDPVQPAIPLIAPQTVADEISQGSFNNMDKEYGDFDNDGDVDILFTKTNSSSNSPELHVLINSAGPGNDPVYTLPGVNLNVDFSYSFRLFDWDNDGWNDVVLYGHNAGLYVFINNQVGGLNPTPITLLQGTVDFTYVDQALIAVGDLSNDGLPDIVISSQNVQFPGTVYFENVGGNTLVLPAPQVWTPGVGITSPFIFENGGSYPTPEIYDADCDGDMDLFLSDPLFGPPFGGGRMYFHENNGALTTNSLPDVNVTGVTNQYGFLDDIDPSSELACDWLITRIVDYKGDGCAVAISYNPCNDEFFFYDQDCECGGILAVNDYQDAIDPIEIRMAPNPTIDSFRISSEIELSSSQIAIYDMHGRIVLKTSLTNGDAIDVRELSSGLYLVELTISEGRTFTKKLIKK